MYAMLIFVGALVVTLTMTPVGEPIVDRFGMTGVIVIAGVAAGALLALRELLAESFAGWIFGSDRGNLASRRKMIKHPGRVTRAESAAEALSDEVLAARIEKNPRDAIALEIHCERLKRAGRLADYARELEYLLSIPNELTAEERATFRHELADLYLGPLAQPARARAALEAVAAEMPRSYQATLARRRIEQMTAPREE